MAPRGQADAERACRARLGSPAMAVSAPLPPAVLVQYSPVGHAFWATRGGLAYSHPWLPCPLVSQEGRVLLSGPRPGSLGAWKCASGQQRTAPASGSALPSDPSRRSQRPVHAAHPLLALWPPLKCWVFRDQTASLGCSSSSGAGLLCCGGVSHKCLNREVCSGTSGPPQHGPLHGCAPVHVSRTGLQGPGREGSLPAVPWTGRGAHPCTFRPFPTWPAQACQGQEALKGLGGLRVPARDRKSVV